MNQVSNVPYRLGLDIGIASVGWSLIGANRIIDLGVRIFDRAETTDGESLNKVRRDSRLMRRRLRHRAIRLLRVSRLLKREGLITDTMLFSKQIPGTESPWRLRLEGLDRLLSPEEWARVIYHLCKHRGFWFQRKSEAENSEGGRVKQGLERTNSAMNEKSYRTAAEMMLGKFPDNQRNKRGSYEQALARELLAEELKTLFESQRKFGNPHASEAFEDKLLNQKTGWFWLQRPALSGAKMLGLIGKCTFEPAEFRAAKRSYSAERFVWLTRLLNIRISANGEIRPLSDAARNLALGLPYEKASLTWKQLKKHLVDKDLLDPYARFTGLNYRAAKDPEDAKLIELSGWHQIRKALDQAGLSSDWAALAIQPSLMDAIATILTIYKTDEEITAELKKIGLSDRVIEALLTLSFSDFIRLSTKALSRILPFMEQGQRYDEACVSAGYHHSVLQEQSESRYLPPLDDEAPRNPVVLRALNQARKVVNALIREYGSPASVHIEMARDLSHPLDERQKIQRNQEAYRDQNEKSKILFEEIANRRPSGRELEKWLLYHEQDGKCAYSLEPIYLERVINEPSYTEVDHILPYSRSFDDSRNNKVLVLTRENQRKGNQTPYEYLGGEHETEQWQRFRAYVTTNHKFRQAKRDRLLRKGFSKEEASSFKERNLNDTRYICRYFKNFVERNLALASDSKRCVVLSGQLTAFLRARWGLVKVREDNDRHHALDATVIAACDHQMVNKLAQYARRRELEMVKPGYVDRETGTELDAEALLQIERDFPKPWEHFHEDLVTRLSDNPGEGVRKLFVSRAPKRRSGGAAHKETIYAQPKRLKEQGGVTQKIALTSLTMANLDHLVDPGRNKQLYEAIRKRLEAFDGKADKAFAQPLYKLLKDGSPGPVVRAVKVEIDKLSGIPVRGGIAKNDTMLRVDIFSKSGKFYLVPVYVFHVSIYVQHKILPNRAIVAYKDEEEWTDIDNSFGFCFSLYPNDLAKIILKTDTWFGYYAGTDRATGAINIWVHDRDKNVGKDGLIRGIGVKTALSIEKFHVDVLGRIYKAKPETRHGLA